MEGGSANEQDRTRLPSAMNAALDRVLEPGERVELAMKAGVAATDRRLFLWKKKALRAYRYEDLWGIEWTTGIFKFLVPRGPGLATIGSATTNPDALQVESESKALKEAMTQLVMKRARAATDLSAAQHEVFEAESVLTASPLISVEGATEAVSILEKYSVSYRGGLPEHPKGKLGGIEFMVLPDAFLMLPTAGSKGWFSDLRIPYDKVASFQLAPRQVSTFEGILGGLDSRQLNQDNNLHIDFRQDGRPLLLRLEMLSGFSVMGQAAKCRELMDRLRVHGILERLNGSDPAPRQGVEPDLLGQAAQLGALHKAGILTDDEFESKKTELLRRL